MITKTVEKDMMFNEPYAVYRQELNDRISYLPKNYISIASIKRKLGTKKYQKYVTLKQFPDEATIKWLREHYPKEFKRVMIEEKLGDALLDLRIKKNMDRKSKRAILLRDTNYKMLFGVERALELHPCYFDSY